MWSDTHTFGVIPTLWPLPTGSRAPGSGVAVGLLAVIGYKGFLIIGCLLSGLMMCTQLITTNIYHIFITNVTPLKKKIPTHTICIHTYKLTSYHYEWQQINGTAAHATRQLVFTWYCIKWSCISFQAFRHTYNGFENASWSMYTVNNYYVYFKNQNGTWKHLCGYNTYNLYRITLFCNTN